MAVTPEMLQQFQTLLLAAQEENGAEATRALQGAMDNNLPLFILTVVQSIANEGDVRSRQLAALLLKQTMHSSDPVVKQQCWDRWLTLDMTLRGHVKNELLKALVGSPRDVAMQVAQAVAKIACAELEQDQWPEVMEMMAGSVQTGAPNVREAALRVLGYICDEINPDVLRKMPQMSNQVLTAIWYGLQPTETVSVRLTAVTALQNTLAFAAGNMEEQAERDRIMTLICDTCRAAEEDVRTAAFECLARVALLYYDKLPGYMALIYELTMGTIVRADESDEVVQQAIEFWSTVAEEETSRMAAADEAAQRHEKPEYVSIGFIKGALDHLVPALTMTLLKQEDDGGEESADDDWNAAMAAGTCLAFVARVVPDEVVMHVMPFINLNVAHTDWRHREAATLALGSILEGQSELIQRLIQETLAMLLSHMADPAVQVRDTTAWTLGRICQQNPAAIMTQLPVVVPVLVASLRDAPRVAGNVCWAIHSLGDAYADDCDEDAALLSPYFSPLMAALLEATQRTDIQSKTAYHALRVAAYEAMNMLIQSTPRGNLPMVAIAMPVFIDKLRLTFSETPMSAEDRGMQHKLQALLCGVLQVCTARLPADKLLNPTSLDPGAISIADAMMSLFLQVLHSRNANVHEEALMAISALAVQLEGTFERYLPALEEPLCATLAARQEAQTCSVAVGTVGDICRAVADRILPQAQRLMTILVENLQSRELAREIRPSILSCFGDVALAISGNFEPFLTLTLELLKAATGTVPPENADDDFMDYLNQLREAIFEAYTGIINGLRTDNKAHLIYPHVPVILGFVNLCWRDQDRFEGVTRGAVGVLGDLAFALGPAVKPLLQVEEVRQVLHTALQQDESIQTREVATWARQQITKL